MAIVAEFTNTQGKNVVVEKHDVFHYYITVDGRVTQKDLTADQVIGWFANASNTYVPDTLELKVGRSYLTTLGKVVRISEVITESEDSFAFSAGYRFRSESGRNYTSSGDHNDPDLCLVKEVRTA